jgi:hypothetical protein
LFTAGHRENAERLRKEKRGEGREERGEATVRS